MVDQVKRSTSQPTLTRFARILLTLGSGETIWLIVTFVLGVTALGIFSNFIFGVVANPSDWTWASALRVLAAVGVFIVLAYGAYQYDLYLALRTRVNIAFDERRLAPCHPGLIWLLSPGSPELPLIAIRHHLNGPADRRLRHCWMLISPGAQEAFERLSARLDELNYEVTLHEVPLEGVTIEATYRAVDHIYTTEAARVELAPDQLIADMTGGLKPMTAGMVLACLPHGRSLEYIESQRDAAGQPIPETQHAVLVGVDFTRSAQAN